MENGLLDKSNEEIWRGIIGFPKYEISNYGRIKSLRRYRVGADRVLKNMRDTQGYHCIGLRIIGLRKYPKRIHNLVMSHFGPPKESNELQINHIDGDKNNNRIDNLEWVTPSENIRHNFKLGITNSFTWGKVDRVGIVSMKEARLSGHKPKDIAKYFGVSVEVVYNVTNGRSYTRL